MTCIHGLDEFNCPICRITFNTVPKDGLKIMNKELKLINPYIQEDSKNKQDFIDSLKPSGPNYREKPHFINELKPNLLNHPPSLKNDLFKERLEEIDLKKKDKHWISQRFTLASPEYNLD